MSENKKPVKILRLNQADVSGLVDSEADCVGCRDYIDALKHHPKFDHYVLETDIFHPEHLQQILERNRENRNIDENLIEVDETELEGSKSFERTWKRPGHEGDEEDEEETRPNTIIVGTGYSGRMIYNAGPSKISTGEAEKLISEKYQDGNPIDVKVFGEDDADLYDMSRDQFPEPGESVVLGSVDPKTIDVETLTVDSIEYSSIQFDWSEEDMEKWHVIMPDYIEEDPDEIFAPIYNSFYPLPSGTAFDGEDAEKLMINCPNLVIVETDAHGTGLALTACGMDLTWEIVHAYVLMGCLPPRTFCRPPKMAEPMTEVKRLVLRACRRAVTVQSGWNESAIRDLDDIEKWTEDKQWEEDNRRQSEAIEHWRKKVADQEEKKKVEQEEKKKAEQPSGPTNKETDPFLPY